MTGTDWATPETWHVGDDIDAETWLRRWNDPMALLLRRPLTSIRRTTDLSVSAETGWNYGPISFDTIDIDDDGMVQTVTPITTLYVMRSGVYDLYVAAPFISNNASGNNVVGVGLIINGSSASDFYKREGPLSGASGTDQAKAATFTMTLSEGDQLGVTVRNQTPSSVTLKAQYNGPRFTVLWRGPEA